MPVFVLRACDGNCVCAQTSSGLVSGTAECCLQEVFSQTIFFLMLLLSPHWNLPHFSLFSQMCLIRGFHVTAGKGLPHQNASVLESFFLKDLTQIPPLSHRPGDPWRAPDSAEISALTFTWQCHLCALKAQGKA